MKDEGFQQIFQKECNKAGITVNCPMQRETHQIGKTLEEARQKAIDEVVACALDEERDMIVAVEGTFTGLTADEVQYSIRFSLGRTTD